MHERSSVPPPAATPPSIGAAASAGVGGSRPSPSASDETWTTRTLLGWMARRFGEGGLDAPRLQAEHLLASVLGCERIRLYMEADRPASADERERLRGLVRRLVGGEPLQLVVGEAEFRGRMFACAPCTQIPQPCTGEVVDAVLEAFAAGTAPRILDLGTGSGVVGLTILAERPRAQGVLVDVEPEACRLAAANAERLGVADRVRIVAGDLDAPLAADDAFDAIVGNLPYIPDAEWEGGLVEPGVMRHVPARALRGGPDGLSCIRRVLAFAPRRLREGGVLALECADRSAEMLRGLVAADPDLADPAIRRDEDDLRRVVTARRR